MRTAVYAGSFDPLTNGHLWMIREGSELYDELVVAVGINPEKKHAFALEDRLTILKRSTRQFPNVKIDSFENQFLVNYANAIGAKYILRGIRTESDYGTERGMRYLNGDLNPDVVTIFLMPPRELVEISSSLVKGLVGPNGWEDIIESYVPRSAYNSFLVNFKGLYKKWDKLWKSIGAKDHADELYDELVASYGESHRVYHNLVHIAHTLRELDRIKNVVEKQVELELALWYHDSVYDPMEHDNEEKSAELASLRLNKAGMNQTFIKSVIDLILATKHQAIPTTLLEQQMADIDLAILGKPEQEFDEYEREIREEYSFVPEEQFRHGRSLILKGILDRNMIYATPQLRQKYEDSARKNLQRSIMQLNR